MVITETGKRESATQRLASTTTPRLALVPGLSNFGAGAYMRLSDRARCSWMHTRASCSRAQLVQSCWCECVVYGGSKPLGPQAHSIFPICDCPPNRARYMQCKRSFTNRRPDIPPTHRPDADPSDPSRWPQHSRYVPMLLCPTAHLFSMPSLAMILDCREYE